MSFTIGDDQIDTRDIVERVEELDAIHDGLYDAAHEDDATPEAVKKYEDWCAEENGECLERATLKLAVEEIEGYAGDSCKDGVQLIEEDYFEKAMDELLEDCGDLPKDLPCYLKITVDYDALKQDYTSVEIDGFTYWYR